LIHFCEFAYRFFLFISVFEKNFFVFDSVFSCSVFGVVEISVVFYRFFHVAKIYECCSTELVFSKKSY